MKKDIKTTKPKEGTRAKASSKGFLVTISQIPIEKTQDELNKILCSVREKEAQLGHKIIALAASLESHIDKGIHLHFAIAFDARRTIDLKYWNFLFDKQANIQPITWNQKDSKYRAFNYSVKTGDVSEMDEGAEEILSHIGRTYTGCKLDDFVCKIIEEGTTLLALQTHRLPEVRTYAMKYESMLNRAICNQITIKYELNQSKLRGVDTDIKESFTPEQKEILTWFKNIKKYKSEWPFRECCLMIIGDPKTGKSTLLRHLAEYVRSYNFPVANWFTGYTNNFYQLIIWEEPSFKPHTAEFLKRLLEGVELDLPIKGSLTTKKDRPLLCMCSNHDIKQLFIDAYLSVTERRHCNNSSESLCDCKDLSRCPIKDKHVDLKAIKTRVKEVYIKDTPLFDLIKVLNPIKPKI